MTNSSRREFIKYSAAATAGIALPHRAFAATSEQVNVGIIGCGGRGMLLLDVFKKLPGVRVAAVCDPDRERLDKAQEKAKRAQKCTDMRQVFENSEIDAVVIATCNHWHCLAAIWAMQAGKHVYVEKPLGHSEWEGQQVIAATKRYDRICQVGTQQRSDPMQAEIKKFLHEDKVIGDVESVRVNRFGQRPAIGRRSQPLAPPESVDYNLWLGPAHDIPILRDNLQYDWHWVWNTGSGEMGNWGVHILDDVRNNVFRDSVSAPSSIVAAGDRFAWNDAGETPNVHFAILDADGIPVVVTLSNLPERKEIGKSPTPNSGYVTYCKGGHLKGARGHASAYDSQGKLIRKFKGDSGMIHHQQNFIDAIRSNSTSGLTAPVQVGHDSTTWSNLINIATRIPKAAGGSTIGDFSYNFGSESASEVFTSMRRIAGGKSGSKAATELALGPTLQFDSLRNEFTGEHASAANGLLRRDTRKQFEIPEIETVSVTS